MAQCLSCLDSQNTMLLQYWRSTIQATTLHLLTPVDKATNNAAFVYLRFFAQVLVKEPGLENSNASITYCCIFESNANIKSNLTMLEKKLLHKILPGNYWFPNLHKYPAGSTIVHKIFETNSSFYVKYRNTRNVQYISVFTEFLVSIKKMFILTRTLSASL